MKKEEAITNLNMISVAYVVPVTKEQRKLIDDTFDMAIKALEQMPEVTSTMQTGQFDYVPIRDVSKQQPCDAISREDALMCLTGMFKLPLNYNPEDLIALFSKRIKALPSVTQEPKTGHWIDYQEGRWIYAKCSECGTVHNTQTNFCPNCGTDMKG